jgi:hypothetical protein
MRKLGVSRRQLFEQLDQPALSELPAEPFVYAEWRIRRVALDYHVDIEGHYYSVPHRLLREQVEARVTARTIELFHKGEHMSWCGAVCGAHWLLRWRFQRTWLNATRLSWRLSPSWPSRSSYRD